MEAARDTREVRFLHFEPYSPVVLRILMNKKVDKIKLRKTLFPNCRNISSQNKEYLKIIPRDTAVGIIGVHLLILISVTRTYVHG